MCIWYLNVCFRPAVYLPSNNQYTVAVRCCPLLFELQDRESMFALPYRMILAVATQTSVLLYDTQQPEPFGIVTNIHYTRLTDVTWWVAFILFHVLMYTDTIHEWLSHVVYFISKQCVGLKMDFELRGQNWEIMAKFWNNCRTATWPVHIFISTFHSHLICHFFVFLFISSWEMPMSWQFHTVHLHGMCCWHP